MRRRWLVTDVDGTITDAQGRIDLGALDAIHTLERSGTAVGLSSGRPYYATRILAEYIGVTGPVFAENGGVCYFDGVELFVGSRDAPDRVARMLTEQYGLSLTWDSRYRQTDCALDRTDDTLSTVEKVVDHSSGVDVHVSSIMVHLSSVGVSKGFGVVNWCRRFGIRESDVAVCGDADSDITLFEEFECSLAPANCTERLANLASFLATAPFGQGFRESVDFLKASNWLAA